MKVDQVIVLAKEGRVIGEDGIAALVTEIEQLRSDKAELACDIVRFKMHLECEERAAKYNAKEADRWEKLHNINCASLANEGYKNAKIAEASITYLREQVANAVTECDKQKSDIEELKKIIQNASDKLYLYSQDNKHTIVNGLTIEAELLRGDTKRQLIEIERLKKIIELTVTTVEKTLTSHVGCGDYRYNCAEHVVKAIRAIEDN